MALLNFNNAGRRKIYKNNIKQKEIKKMGIIKLKKIEEETSTVEGLEKSAVTEEIIPVENVAA